MIINIVDFSTLMEKDINIYRNRDLNKDVESQTETFKNLGEVISISHEMLTRNGWNFASCENCNNAYYAKEETTASNCSSNSCTGEYEFLNLSRKRKSMELLALSGGFSDFFSQNGYSEVKPIHIVNRVGNTLFTGNAGQFFDREIFRETAYDSTPVFIKQPVIRMQGEDIVGKVDGFTTSFVNVATEQLDASPEQHTHNLDLWMEFLSKSGLYMGDFTLKPKLERTNWGELNDIDTYTLKFNYKGLELGVANYAIIPQRSRPPIAQSDLTFGLERVLWAINKNSSYFDLIGPFTYSLRGEHVKMDSYRTTTLMAASDVRPSNQDRGSKFRLFANKISSLDDEFNPDLVKYYYDWWKQFTDFPNSLATTTTILRREINRNRNLRIQRTMGKNSITPNLNTSVDIDTDEFVRKSFRNSRDLDKIRDALTGDN